MPSPAETKEGVTITLRRMIHVFLHVTRIHTDNGTESEGSDPTYKTVAHVNVF